MIAILTVNSKKREMKIHSKIVDYAFILQTRFRVKVFS